LPWDDFYQNSCLQIMKSIKTYKKDRGRTLRNWVLVGLTQNKLGEEHNRLTRENVWKEKEIFSGVSRIEGMVFEDNNVNIEKDYAEKEYNYRLFEKNIFNLDKRQKDILYRTVFMGEEHKDVAVLYGVSRQRVTQIKNDVLDLIYKRIYRRKD